MVKVLLSIFVEFSYKDLEFNFCLNFCAFFLAFSEIDFNRSWYFASSVKTLSFKNTQQVALLICAAAPENIKLVDDERQKILR